MEARHLIYRQGDVILVKVDSMPNNATEEKSREDGKVILAWGEVTGHHHRIENDINAPAPAARLWSAQAERFLQVMEKTALVHEEHSAIPLPPGVYRVALQTEYTPQALRTVAD